MANFSGSPVNIDKSAAEVVAKFDDLSQLQAVIDAMPDEQRARIGDVSLTRDSIVIKTQQVGEINFKVTERTPERVVFTAVGAPVPLSLNVDVKPIDPQRCTLVASMDVNIPPFLKPMVGGAMQKAVDQFGSLMSKLA